MFQTKKGIFWVADFESDHPRLITVAAQCDADGKSVSSVEYSSKSKNNFNHKTEWQKLTKTVTKGLPYNYYPRGRVEIKNKKATVYLNPDINTAVIVEIITDFFNLKISNGLISVKIKNDGSKHYQYLCKTVFCIKQGDRTI